MSASSDVGMVYLVGAGPRDAGLITVRGLELLEKADVIIYDALADPQLLDRAGPDAECIDVGKRAREHKKTQQETNDLMVQKAQAGNLVVRLKGGDPMLFGRAQEGIGALRQAGVTVEIVPGISAALAASADVGQSLTQRGISRSVVFVTPRFGNGESDHDWARPAAAAGSGQAPASP